ncbi:MAG: sugar kinase [Rhizobiaceae bacterium]|jgi:hypothetical protein
MKKVIVIGEILVEIMADSVGAGFQEPIAMTGPFPSGAPAIFIDQVARMGQPCAILSTVGNDDFGTLNLSRLKADGVDISGVRVDQQLPTGTAFVRYRQGGTRDFIYNIRHSACGLPPNHELAEGAVSAADHIHVMGSSLASPDLIALNLRAVQDVRGRGGTVSLDPNLRKEILETPGLRAAMTQILAMTDLFLPSGQELMLLTDANEHKGAIEELLKRGIKAVVHKLGDGGARYHDTAESLFLPAFNVDEVDPTGAGDCFGGAFTALWLRGTDTLEALSLAAAAGALAVTKRGPMEGAATIDELRAFVVQQSGGKL